MFRLFRFGRQTVGGAILVASIIAFFASNPFAALKLAFAFWDPFSISEYRLLRYSTEQYLASIEASINEGEIDDAQMLVEIAHEQGHKLPSDLIAKTQENPFEFSLRYSEGFIRGASTGEITNWPSLLGSVASDFFVVGDIRDVAIQGNQMLQGKEYDALTLGLGLFGIVTSSAIITPASPVAAPADLGAALIKNANKMRKLSSPLRKNLVAISTRLINENGLKRGLSQISIPKFKRPSISTTLTSFRIINWSQVARGDFSELRKPISEMMPVDGGAMKTGLVEAVNSGAVGEFKILATAVGGVASKGDIKAAFRAMEHADNVRDLSRFQKLTTRMGKKSSVVIKIFGNHAIKLGKLIYLVVSVLIGVLAWILGALWFSYSSLRNAYRLVKRV